MVHLSRLPYAVVPIVPCSCIEIILIFFIILAYLWNSHVLDVGGKGWCLKSQGLPSYLMVTCVKRKKIPNCSWFPTFSWTKPKKYYFRKNKVTSLYHYFGIISTIGFGIISSVIEYNHNLSNSMVLITGNWLKLFKTPKLSFSRKGHFL